MDLPELSTGMAMLMLTELLSRNGLREKRISRSRNGNLYTINPGRETIPDTEVIVGKGDEENENSDQRRLHQRTWPIRI